MATSVAPGAGAVYKKPTQSTWVQTGPYQGYDVGELTKYSWGADPIVDSSGNTTYRGQYGTGSDARYAYINPKSGQISYNTTTGTKSGKSYNAAVGSDQYGGWNNFQYSGTNDYGTGISGVIPMSKDPVTGAVTSYFAMMPNGGGKVFTDLAEAQAAASGYSSWKADQEARYPGAGSVQTATTTPSTSTSSGLGTQTTPGVGEEWQKQHAAQYDQPTNSEQLWNQYSGKFGNWDSSGLGGVYDREQARTQRLMDARASSRGYGDSSAAVRASAGLGQRFADAKVKSQEDWAKTGMGLAGSADTGKFTRLGAGQSAANDAQSAKLLRESSGLNSALQLGNALSNTAQSGLGSIEQQSLDLYLQGLNAKMQSGMVDANTAMQQAKDWMAFSGIATNPTVLNYIGTKLGGGTGGTTYKTQTINY